MAVEGEDERWRERMEGGRKGHREDGRGRGDEGDMRGGEEGRHCQKSMDTDLHWSVYFAVYTM